MTRALVVLALVASSLVVAATGCGSSSAPHVATGSSAPTSTSATTERSASDHFQASVNYVNCMRQHGIPLPDPKPNGDIELSPGDEQRLEDITPGEHDAADKSCFHLLDGFVDTAPVSDQALARVADVALAFAACMRRKGFEFGDPQVTRGKLGRVKILFPDAPYPHDLPGTHPKLDAAQAVCNRGFNERVDEALRP